MEEKESKTIEAWSERSGSIAKLAAALSKAQGKIEGAKKDSANPFYNSKYADLAAVWDAIRGPLTENELSVIQEPGSTNGRVVLTTTLIHSSGEYIRSSLSVPVVKQDPQGYGSAITYARRYALQSIAGIAPEDDDGNAGSGVNPGVPNEPKSKAKKNTSASPVTTANGAPVMPGGKHAGKAMKDVPADYLQWMIDNNHGLKAIAESELIRREQIQMQEAQPGFADGDDLPESWSKSETAV